MHGRGVLSKIQALQSMVDQMKTALEEAQADLIIAKSWAKLYADPSRHDEVYEVGNEVVFLTHNLNMNQHLPSKLRQC